MAELQHFTLGEMMRIMESNDAMSANNYISQNLAIARNPQMSIIKAQLMGESRILPEMRMMILTRGWTEPILNMVPYHFDAGELIFLGANSIARIRDASDDVQAFALSMSDDLFQLVIGNHIPKAFDGHLRDFHFHLEPDDQDFLDRLHHLIYINTRKMEHSPQATLHLLSSFLWYVDQLWSRHEESYKLSQSREQRLFTNFIQLVSLHAPQQHTIDFYASQLYLSPRYMSTLVKKVSGRAAKEWIDDAIITRIKIELKHSDKTIVQIADSMNFPNPSFFSKYFKRLTSMTPAEFRLS